MKHFISFFAAPVLASSLSAQFLSLPPSSTDDGIIVQSIGMNAGTDQWNSSSGLAAYQFSSDTNTDRINLGTDNNPLGLTWQNSPSADAAAAKNLLNTTGGTIRAIFLGETAGWLNDFGYTYSGNPSSDSYTISHAIQSSGASANVQFGQYVDLSLPAGGAANFDFWLNAVGAMGTNPQPGPSASGGIYTAFDPANSSPGSGTRQFAWATSPIAVNTYLPQQNGYAPVETYLISAEDWRIGTGSDKDFSDYTFALQFFDANGTPIGAVPEPAAAALLIGSLALSAGLYKRKAARC